MHAPDRMAVYEAPRTAIPQRAMRVIHLRCSGKTPGGSWQNVQIPKGMPLPDVIKWRGRIFVQRVDDLYGEATMWPIVEELDADP